MRVCAWGNAGVTGERAGGPPRPGQKEKGGGGDACARFSPSRALFHEVVMGWGGGGPAYLPAWAAPALALVAHTHTRPPAVCALVVGGGAEEEEGRGHRGRLSKP